MDAVRQERPGVQVRHADDAEPAGLVLGQLQIRPGERDLGERRHLTGVDRIHLQRAIFGEGGPARGDGLGIAQPRGDGDGVPGRAGDRRDVGALLGPDVPPVDQDGGPAVDDEGCQHLERRLALDHPQPGQHLNIRQVMPAGRDAAPLRIRGRGILLRQQRFQWYRRGVEGVLDLPVLPRRPVVLAQLPGRQHREAQVGEGDDHQAQGYPAGPQQKRQPTHVNRIRSGRADRRPSRAGRAARPR